MVGNSATYVAVHSGVGSLPDLEYLYSYVTNCKPAALVLLETLQVCMYRYSSLCISGSFPKQLTYVYNVNTQNFK